MNSLMEWNAKIPLQWDWENLIMFNATAAENPRKLQQTEWEIDGDVGIDSASFFSSGGGGYSGGSGSDLGPASLSKSSKSPSNNSSSMGETRTSKFDLETFEEIPEDFGGKKEFAKAKPTASSSTLEASVGSGEPLLGLKLGKRMYYEDVYAGSNAKNPSFSVTPASTVVPSKRSKINSQSMHAPACCQVEGCGLDLSSAKDYHRKHRVCESHSKCPKVIVGGVERRFCQQCSRFHGLSEFDEKKRSCRRRLSDHNARRRKPQPETIRLNPGRLSSSLYGEEESMISFNLGAAQDCHRALSLLSKGSWGLCEPKQVSLDHPINTSNTSMPPTAIHAVTQGSPLTSAEYRRTGKQATESQVHTLSSHNDDGNYIQEIQLFRGPYESGFYSSHLN